jgi:Uncharacterized protein conserved in bacteria (DUF2242)
MVWERVKGSPWGPVARLGAGLTMAVLMTGCVLSSKPPGLPPNEFVSTQMHSRVFDTTDAQACEAARRTLLSQGYVTGTTLVTGRKGFQPEVETHLELEIRVVCAAADNGPRPAIVFLSAQQDRYTLKKSNNSASLGVGAIGSLSVPLPSSSDSLVKVGNETINNAQFYERFFELVQKYLPDSDEKTP